MTASTQFDPTDPGAFTHRSTSLKNGHVYHYVDEPPAGQGPARGTCLLLHGFPDLWYGWRYQIAALKHAGFRCIVPSCLGYGQSSKPDEIRAYGFKAMSADLQELLETIGITTKVLLFGHDWGGVLAWRFAAYYPKSVKAIAVASTPYAPPAQNEAQWMDLDNLVRAKLPNFGYQMFFASDDAPALLQPNLRSFLGFMFAQAESAASAASAATSVDDSWTRPGVLKSKLKKLDALREAGKLDAARDISSSPETMFYFKTFREQGIRHPLMWYKTRRVCFDEELASRMSARFPSGIPALFLAGSDDEALPLAMSARSSAFFDKDQYRRVILDNADHWLLQRKDQRDKVSEILVNWALQASGSEAPYSKL